MKEIIAVSIPIVAIISGVIFLILYRRFENLEKMAMIDKGINPKDFKNPSNSNGVLRWGLLLVGGSLGVIVGWLLDEITHLGEVAYFAMIILCGGIGLLISYRIEDKKRKEEADKAAPIA